MTIEKLAERMNPRPLNFSPKMAYILQAIFGIDAYGVRDGKGGLALSLSVTSDGFLIASSSAHESGAFLGSVSELESNLELLMDAADLTTGERIAFERVYAANVKDWRS